MHRSNLRELISFWHIDFILAHQFHLCALILFGHVDFIWVGWFIRLINYKPGWTVVVGAAVVGVAVVVSKSNLYIDEYLFQTFSLCSFLPWHMTTLTQFKLCLFSRRNFMDALLCCLSKFDEVDFRKQVKFSFVIKNLHYSFGTLPFYQGYYISYFMNYKFQFS